MDTPVYITWSTTNWVTVGLMALLSFVVVGTIAGFLRKNKAEKNA
jgi:uncharacterized membrane protein SirB2